MNNIKELCPQAYDLVYEFFDEQDFPAKTEIWFTTENPLLGNLTPLHMIQIGRQDKLIKFIQSQLESNL